MSKKRTLRHLGLCVFILTACLVSFNGASAQERKEILIGAPLSLSGMLAMDGIEQQWAYEQSATEINKTGGIFVKEFNKKLPIKLVVADDESDSGKAAAAVEKLIRINNVDLLLSTHSTPLVLPTCVTPINIRNFIMPPPYGPPLWREQKFQWSTAFFFTPMQGSEVPFQIFKSVPESERPKNLALLMEDSIDGRGFGGGFRETAKKFKYTFALDEPWAVGAKDYSSQILKLKANNVDGMLIFGSPQDCITLVRQIKENGLEREI